MSIDLSPDRLRILINNLGPYTRPTCHITGTNGKGSVSALISTILQSSSPPLKVGRFNSPHLVSIYDCITINNIPVSPASYNAACLEVIEKDHKGTELGSFETLTLTAFKVLEKEQVDVAVVEVGMGGKFDTTNIMPDEAILVSALTAVDLDHQTYLGNTVGEIAFGKAGMARKGRPFVLGFQNPAHAEEVVHSVKKAVDEIGAVLVPAISVLKRDWDTTIDGPTPDSFSLLSSAFQLPPPQPIQISLPCFSSPLHALLPLYGAHQFDNLGTALTVISALLTDPLCEEKLIRTHGSLSTPLKDIITPESVARGIKDTKWPGRLCFHTVHLSPSSHTPNAPPPPFLVLADGAHNLASAKTLASYITHLLSLTLASAKTRSSSPKLIRVNLNITYILSLSHAPPKKPIQTLSPLLPIDIPFSTTDEFCDISVSTTISVVLPRFTLPERMPWVKCVPPTEVEAAVKELISDAETWVVPDIDPEVDEESALEKALRWASGKRRKSEGGVEQANLVVLAGSLYLVADFYRFLDRLT